MRLVSLKSERELEMCEVERWIEIESSFPKLRRILLWLVSLTRENKFIHSPKRKEKITLSSYLASCWCVVRIRSSHQWTTWRPFFRDIIAMKMMIHHRASPLLPLGPVTSWPPQATHYLFPSRSQPANLAHSSLSLYCPSLHRYYYHVSCNEHDERGEDYYKAVASR